MLAVKGRFINGVAHPEEPVMGCDQEDVIITFLNERLKPSVVARVRETDYDSLTKLIGDCQVDTGIEDLAHQHDHYLYGTPKRTEP